MAPRVYILAFASRRASAFAHSRADGLESVVLFMLTRCSHDGGAARIENSAAPRTRVRNLFKTCVTPPATR